MSKLPCLFGFHSLMWDIEDINVYIDKHVYLRIICAVCGKRCLWSFSYPNIVSAQKAMMDKDIGNYINV